MATNAILHWQYALAKSELRVANVLKKGKAEAMSKFNRARARYSRSMTGRPPLQWHDDTVPVTIAGIPASVKVTHYSPGSRGRSWGRPENCYPPEDPEVSYVVCDRDGYEAGQWLLDKLPADFDRQVMEAAGYVQ